MANNITDLPLPEKSESDIFTYKFIQLPNGLKALLISDPRPVSVVVTQIPATTDENMEVELEYGGEEEEEEDAGDEGEENFEIEECDSSEANSNASQEEEENSEADDDEQLDKDAACALLVNVGSFSDPLQYPGLAHLMEHMLFKGSVNHPLPDAFEEFIKKCGGFENAMTNAEYTVFYFDVPNKDLESSIQIFTELLKNPLLRQNEIEGECDKIQKEYNNTLQNDETRRDRLLANTASDGYPHRKFLWGNRNSLLQDVNMNELHETLCRFRAQNYSAHRMIVCVQARLAIEELQILVLEYFGGIASNYLEIVNNHNFSHDRAFKKDFYEKVLYIEPVAHTKLDLSWVLPPMLKHYKCKASALLCHILGYEGEGGLSAYLRQKRWGWRLLAGTFSMGFDNNSIYTLLSMCVYLTNEGLNHIDDVLSAIFAYIKLLQDHNYLKNIYEELQAIQCAKFRFEAQQSAIENVQRFVVMAKYFEPVDILKGNHIYSPYNEELMQDIISRLNTFNFNISITAPQNLTGVELTKTEKWMGTYYEQLPMPQKWLHLWQNSKPLPELHLPPANAYVSRDFALHWHKQGKPTLPELPQLLQQTAVSELWFKQDNRFEKPFGIINLHLLSPLIRQDIKNDVMCNIYAELITCRWREELYAAKLAGYTWEIFPTELGLMLQVKGYNEKLPLVIDAMGKTLKNVNNYIQTGIFETLKLKLKRSFFDDLIKPRVLMKDISINIMEHMNWLLIDKYKVLPQITAEDMHEFAKKFTQELYIQSLMQGNLTQDIALSILNNLVATLDCKAVVEKQYIESRTVQLPEGSHYIQCYALNLQELNTYVLNTYQLGPSNLRIEATLDLLLELVNNLLEDTFCEKEKRGHLVYARSSNLNGVAQYAICINSLQLTYNAKDVEIFIDKFQNKMAKLVEEMSIEFYDDVRNQLIEATATIDTCLEEESKRHWEEIIWLNYVFDRPQKIIAILRSLSKLDVVEFCLNTQPQIRKLSVQVNGLGILSAEDIIAQLDVESAEPLPDADAEEIRNEWPNSNIVENDPFERLHDKIDVEFIPQDEDNNVIVNIEEFKAKLYVYPNPALCKNDFGGGDQ